jgi:hypothetical protein
MPSRSRRSDSSVSRPNPTIIAIVLVVIGATVALGAERLANPATASPTPRPTATADAADLSSQDPTLADASDEPSDLPSDSAGPSPSPVAPLLEAAMPHKINDTALTVEADLGSSILGTDPGSRSFAAAVATLGITADKLEVAFAYDEAGALPLTVVGFRLPGVAVAKLQPLVLQAWLSTLVPGVKSAPVTLGTVAATKVSYNDEGADEFVFTRGDAVFIVETSDEAMATAAAAATRAPASGPAASPASS